MCCLFSVMCTHHNQEYQCLCIASYLYNMSLISMLSPKISNCSPHSDLCQEDPNASTFIFLGDAWTTVWLQENYRYIKIEFRIDYSCLSRLLDNCNSTVTSAIALKRSPSHMLILQHVFFINLQFLNYCFTKNLTTSQL